MAKQTIRANINELQVTLTPIGGEWKIELIPIIGLGWMTWLSSLPIYIGNKGASRIIKDILTIILDGGEYGDGVNYKPTEEIRQNLISSMKGN